MELDVLGLSAETQRVYTALVGLPRSPAARIAEACGMSPSTAGRLLSQLARDGLATRAAGRPPSFTAAAPDVAVTALIQQREHRLDAARSLVQRLTETHREALRIADPDIAVELLTSREDISAAAHRLAAGAQREVRGFDRPPYVDRPGGNLDTQVGRQRTGVAHRVIYDGAALAWPGRLENDILPSVRNGEQARVRAELPLKLVICDDRSAIIPFSLAPRGITAAYLIHRSPILSALEALFEAEWERAAPLPEGTGQAAGPGPENVHARDLLLLLASGSTDAAIARALGWSPRTTQRRIHRLMADLGATSRFQAAALAARRGWL
jgi:DNA-binding CsgD family transcriptional regulator/DNA-binding Lrp family transcriptional regulator